MEGQESIHPQLESFIEGTLTSEERLAFEKEMQEKPALRELVQEYKQAYQFVKAQRHLDLRQEIDTIALRNQVNPIRRFPIWQTSIAAGLVILVCSTLAFLSIKGRYSDQALFQTHFDPYPLLDQQVRGSGDQAQSEFSEALKAYAMEDYQTAIKLFSRLSQQQLATTDAGVYLASSLLSRGETNQAVELLRKKRKQVGYEPSVEWYLSLAYLGTGQSDSAIQILSSLKKKSDDQFYQNKAIKALSKLENSFRAVPGVK